MGTQSGITGVLLSIEESEGNLVPLKVEVNSWISLFPGNRGGHARDAMRHGGSSIARSYKAKVLKFRFSRAGIVFGVFVQHAYMHRQLCLDTLVPLLQLAACNCKQIHLIVCFNLALQYKFNSFKAIF